MILKTVFLHLRSLIFPIFFYNFSMQFTKSALLGANIVDFNPGISRIPFSNLYGIIRQQSLIISMKEIYGWLLIISIVSLLLILVAYGPMRPWAIFPKWNYPQRNQTHCPALLSLIRRHFKVGETLLAYIDRFF